MRQYIGARYVPKFADPILHDSTRSYEAFEIVQNAIGDSFTSKKPVPVGIALNNTDYWVSSGNFNAQLADVQNKLNGEIIVIESSFDTLNDGIASKRVDGATFESTGITVDNSIIIGWSAYNHVSNSWWSNDSYPARNTPIKAATFNLSTNLLPAGSTVQQALTGLGDKNIISWCVNWSLADMMVVEVVRKGSSTVYANITNQYTGPLTDTGVLTVFYTDPDIAIDYTKVIEPKLRYDLVLQKTYLQVQSLLTSQYTVGDTFRIMIHKYNNVIQC